MRKEIGDQPNAEKMLKLQKNVYEKKKMNIEKEKCKRDQV